MKKKTKYNLLQLTTGKLLARFAVPLFLILGICLIVPHTSYAQDTIRAHQSATSWAPDSSKKRTIAPPILSIYNNRAVDTQLVVETITDTVLVTLIDNGTIDDDSITLVVNGKVAHQGIRLTGNLRYFWIGMVKGQRNQIIMYAENLGQMPPNTALMRIYHSGTTEWIYASSDYNKSFGVILKHKILWDDADAVVTDTSAPGK